MLIKYHAVLEAQQDIKIEKRVHGKRADTIGAFRKGERIAFSVRVPRRLGVSAVVMRIAPDGGQDCDLPLTFDRVDGAEDVYSLTLCTDTLCGEATDGLFYYELLFLRGFDTLFSDSVNNVDFHPVEQSANRFRLLVYAEDYHTPAWFRGGIMYHIFMDRFCRGAGKCSLRAGATLNEDWENGVPQFAPRVGDPLSNDVFFGGNLWGVIEKLDYLQSLGVTVLYLSPVFESVSNHRYDTADYEKIDELLGGEEAFAALISAAHARGMRVILDGVFNHTGDDSRYFNRRGSYGAVGAYQSQQSPYAKWFNFRQFPDDYEAWWGIEIMPRLKHEQASCRRYFTGEDGIAAKWMRAGADGWRLDVADELSDDFLDELNAVVKHESKGEAVMIGEVWENAVDKISYGKRRRYFRGGQLDSVMNYPFRNAILAFLQNGDAQAYYDILTEIYASYPVEVSNSLMNIIGTHDTDRILTLLGDGGKGEGKQNPELAVLRLDPEERKQAKRLLKMAAALQFTTYGIPSIYYGDEVGLEGYHDPFCRFPYPWGREDSELLQYYRALGDLRHRHKALTDGSFAFLTHTECAFAFERADGKDLLIIAANMGTEDFVLPLTGEWWDALSRKKVTGCVCVTSQTAVILEKV